MQRTRQEPRAAVTVGLRRTNLLSSANFAMLAQLPVHEKRIRSTDPENAQRVPRTKKIMQCISSGRGRGEWCDRVTRCDRPPARPRVPHKTGRSQVFGPVSCSSLLNVDNEEQNDARVYSQHEIEASSHEAPRNRNPRVSAHQQS